MPKAVPNGRTVPSHCPARESVVLLGRFIGLQVLGYMMLARGAEASGASHGSLLPNVIANLPACGVGQQQRRLGLPGVGVKDSHLGVPALQLHATEKGQCLEKTLDQTLCPLFKASSSPPRRQDC